MLTVHLLTSASDADSVALAAALERAILRDGAEDQSARVSYGSPVNRATVESVRVAAEQIKISTVESFSSAVASSAVPGNPATDSIVCPLTLAVPGPLSFEGGDVYRACSDVAGLRQRVAAQGYSIADGDTWLPVALTARGPLYGEAIGRAADGGFHQPVHLSDAQRQPLYYLGRWLLADLAVPPAVYLLQVTCRGDDSAGADSGRIGFDRLWPFPAAPALASVGRQVPDLFVCHWRCLTQQPIRDLQIRP